MGIAGRVNSFNHQGTPMVSIDLSGLGPREVIATIDAAALVIRTAAPKSLGTITRVDGAKFDSTVIAALKEFAKGNEPHVHAAAIVGLSGLQRVVLSAVSHFTGRSFALCNTVEEAKDTLVKTGLP